jgi:hypothetical protein
MEMPYRRRCLRLRRQICVVKKGGELRRADRRQANLVLPIEMVHQGLKLDPILQTISDFPDDNVAIIDAMQRDLGLG